MAGKVTRTPFFKGGLLLARSLTQTSCRSLSQLAESPVQEDSSKPLGHPWRVMVAVCVQRLPQLSRERTDIEKRYHELKERLRVERSRLSDYELEEREYMRQKKEREKQALEEEVVVESSNKDAMEFEDLLEARELEMASFQPSSRNTAADQSGDMRTAERRLDKMLYLLVKKNRASHCWQVPQGGLEEGETLLQGAKRGLLQACGSGLMVDFLSNAPSAFLSYCHSHPKGTDIVGSKVFFLKAQYRGGAVQLTQQLTDHVWVTKTEMRDYVTEDYFNSVGPTLIE